MVSISGGGLGGSSGDSSPHVEDTDVSRNKDWNTLNFKNAVNIINN